MDQVRGEMAEAAGSPPASGVENQLTRGIRAYGGLPYNEPMRDALGLAPGARLQASIDRQGRLVLVPSKYEPEDLFLHRPKVNRCLSLEQMEEAIAAATGRPDDREDA